MVEGMPKPVINTSTLLFEVVNGSISCVVAAVSKICIAQISYLHFTFQDLAVTFAEILNI